MLYDLTFCLDNEPPEAVIDDLMDDHDATVGQRHSGQICLAIYIEATSAADAAMRALSTLRRYGIHPRRLDQDLVTRTEIARRLNVTTQAVGNWVRKDRLDGTRFPAPAGESSTEVWVWGDVADWAFKAGVLPEGESDYHAPTTLECDLINGKIAEAACEPEAVDFAGIYWAEPSRTHFRNDTFGETPFAVQKTIPFAPHEVAR